MNFKKLGRSDLKVSAIGLGCWGMSGAYGKGNMAESVATVSEAVEKGINFIDTADIYGSGHNEKLVGKAIKRYRNSVVLASKFGYIQEDNGTMTVRCDPEYVKKACDASLKRLKTDYIDLYYMHRLDKDVPVEETVGAMADLVVAGKIRYLGLSEVSAATIKRANKVHPITAIQSEYSLFTRDVEIEVLPICKELNIGFVAFSPLSRGLLTGQIKNLDQLAADDFRRDQPRWNEKNFHYNLKLVDVIGKVASGIDAKPSQVAMAWLLQAGKNIVPIPGMKTRKYLDENLASADTVLSEESIKTLENLSQNISGERYTPSSLKFLDL